MSATVTEIRSRTREAAVSLKVEFTFSVVFLLAGKTHWPTVYVPGRCPHFRRTEDPAVPLRVWPGPYQGSTALEALHPQARLDEDRGPAELAFAENGVEMHVAIFQPFIYRLQGDAVQ